MLQTFPPRRSRSLRRCRVLSVRPNTRDDECCMHDHERARRPRAAWAARWQALTLVLALAVTGVFGSGSAVADVGLGSPLLFAGCAIGRAHARVASCVRQPADIGGYDTAISPDGQNLYVSGNTLSIFTMPGSGGLASLTDCVERTPGPCSTHDPGMLGILNSVAVSPDGRNVYVAGFSLDVFARAASGRLAPIECFMPRRTGPCRGRIAPGLGAGRSSVTVSPDGHNVYVTNLRTSTLDVFARDVDGALTPQGCLQDTVPDAEPECAARVP